MKISRRAFFRTSLSTVAVPTVIGSSYGLQDPHQEQILGPVAKNRFDPWIEVNREALLFNVKQLSELAGSKPIMAVVKNNAYGLGLDVAAKLLEESPLVRGFAAVKTDECLKLREAGIRKPILLLALASEEEEYELASKDIDLSILTDDAPQRIERISRYVKRPVRIHFYIDTGMSRVGIRFNKALPLIQKIASIKSANVITTFTDLTEDPAYDKEQLARLTGVVDAASRMGIKMGEIHAASSHGVYHFPESHLDLARPGLSLYGAYPDSYEAEKKIKPLKAAFRLQARVVRVEQLQAGDSVSYGRKFIAEKPCWVATIPVGHSDGYHRDAVKGAKILIEGNVFPVIGAVSASHTIVNLGEQRSVNVGDIATLVGPNHPDVEPNAVANACGISVYDILMHMNSALPKIVM